VIVKNEKWATDANQLPVLRLHSSAGHDSLSEVGSSIQVCKKSMGPDHVWKSSGSNRPG